jgi:hypothetical protein
METPTLSSGLHTRSRTLIIVAVALAIVMIGGSIAAYIVLVKVPSELARNTAEGIRQVFNFTPRVQINQTVVVEQNIPVLEVATVSRSLFVDHTWSHTWLASTKTLELQGSFTAKAGFDLHEPFRIVIERSPLRVVAELPRPKILSLQMDSYRVVKDDDGWWNRISERDREKAFQDLQTLARTKVEASGMLTEAQATAESRIREVVERNGAIVEFRAPSKQ